jgi:hypothetical protein
MRRITNQLNWAAWRPIPRQLLLATLVGILVFMSASASADLPTTLHFQARLNDTEGVPTDSPIPLAVDVAIWDSSEAGNLLYEEIHTAVWTVDGLIELEIGGGIATANGSHAQLVDAVAATDDSYLELTIEGETLAPRRQLGSFAFALRATNSIDTASLEGETASTLQRRVASSCPPGSWIRAIDSNGGVTCESDDGEAYAAGSGLTLADTVLAIDPAVTQRRVAGTCAVGSAIRSINEDGSVVCEQDTDTNTTYDAGIGISLDRNVFSIDLNTLQPRTSGVCAKGQYIESIGNDGSISCVASQVGTLQGITTSFSNGLAGGCSSGTCSLSVNSLAQRRVSQSCSIGQVIRSIASDGTVNCVDVGYGDITGINYGSGFSSPNCGFGACAPLISGAVVQRRITTTCSTDWAIKAISSSGTATCTPAPDGDIAGISAGSTSGVVTSGCTSGDCQVGMDPTDFFTAPQSAGLSDTTGQVINNSITTGETLRSDSITAPAHASGTVVVTAHADVRCDGNCIATFRSTLSTSSSASPSSGRPSSFLADNFLLRAFVADVFSISAGQTLTIYWRAGANGANARAYRSDMTLLFIPDTYVP